MAFYPKSAFLTLVTFLVSSSVFANWLLIPMDVTQTNHLKAYGIVYNTIAKGNKASWLLNYKGGSFALPYTPALAAECSKARVLATKLTPAGYTALVHKVQAPAFNGDIIILDKAPRIAVYTPSGKKPWDDAVTLVLTYAGIPFEKLYVSEVLAGELNQYSWLHLHHEDFTGQYGKFWALYKDADWYRNDCRHTELLAAQHGYKKVSQMQLAVVKKIRSFVADGGNLFAMCSAADTYDIALAADGVDICDTPFDGDPIDTDAQSRLNYSRCFAFTGFTISQSLYELEYSNIDNTSFRLLPEKEDYFKLRSFSARYDAVSSMLTQNHTTRIKGFMGQTTAFRNVVLKPGVIVMGENKAVKEARYIHGTYKKGAWTFYGGHDPEDYQHMVGEAPTDLNLHPNSPGYRLILNNVLCLASGKKDVEAVDVTNTAITQPKLVTISQGATSSTLVIALSSQTTLSKIEKVAFVSAGGKEVLVRQYNATSVTVSMETLPAGMYDIKVNNVFAGRVVKN
jgi:hypothetical protein